MIPEAQITTDDGIISWKMDDQVTPELVKRIAAEGDRKGIDWKESPFFEVVKLLQKKYTDDEIEDMLFDEDEELLDFATLVINNPMKDKSETKTMVRLYLPVMLVILSKL